MTDYDSSAIRYYCHSCTSWVDFPHHCESWPHGQDDPGTDDEDE